MAKVKVSNSTGTSRRRRPALTPEARENQLMSLAYDVAEQQLREGTASSQVITHFLKAGSRKDRLEIERLEEENRLLRAKTSEIESRKSTEELYSKAINAIRRYSGHSSVEEEEDFDDDY